MVERDGMIFVWRDEARRQPIRPLPIIEGLRAGELMQWATLAFPVRASTLEILENSVRKFRFEQKLGNGAARLELVRTTPVLELEQHTSGSLFGRHIDATLHYYFVEPGFHYLQLENLPIAPALVVSSITPIDETTVTNRLSIALRRSSGLDRLLAPMVRTVARRIVSLYEEDISNKIFGAPRALDESDGPIAMLRCWYAGFEVEGAAASTPGDDLVELRKPTQKRAREAQ